MIKIKRSYDLSENQVTDESVYNNRRQFIKQMGFVGAGALLSSDLLAAKIAHAKSADEFNRKPLIYSASVNKSLDKLTPENKVITHNNFYEFGAQKDQPAKLAKDFNPDPWQLKISGECEKPYTLDYQDLFTKFAIEERIYRLRCVEAWSMVIPWQGFELANLIKKAMPTSKAKYVAFKTLYDPKRMPGQKNRYLGGGIKYPYVEGLRMDEAMNPLTLMSVGLYGKTLAGQNGAPVRLVVPWKYGFKSIKSVVEIKLVERMPDTTWNILAPNEYGFYANVNPEVDHPRWSQASERRLTGGGLFSRNRIDTQLFNGYGEQVADMYKGMNLVKNY